MIKCVECGKEAEYILNGFSLCQEHFEKIKPAIEMLGKLNLALLKEMKEGMSNEFNGFAAPKG